MFEIHVTKRDADFQIGVSRQTQINARRECDSWRRG